MVLIKLVWKRMKSRVGEDFMEVVKEKLKVLNNLANRFKAMKGYLKEWREVIEKGGD